MKHLSHVWDSMGTANLLKGESYSNPWGLQKLQFAISDALHTIGLHRSSLHVEWAWGKDLVKVFNLLLTALMVWGSKLLEPWHRTNARGVTELLCLRKARRLPVPVAGKRPEKFQPWKDSLVGGDDACTLVQLQSRPLWPLGSNVNQARNLELGATRVGIGQQII